MTWNAKTSNEAESRSSSDGGLFVSTLSLDMKSLRDSALGIIRVDWIGLPVLDTSEGLCISAVSLAEMCLLSHVAADSVNWSAYMPGADAGRTGFSSDSPRWSNQLNILVLSVLCYLLSVIISPLFASVLPQTGLYET